MENRFQTTYSALKHLSSGAYQTRGMMGTEKVIVDETTKSKGFRIHERYERGTLKNHELRSDACFTPRVHACIHTRAILTWTNIGSYSMLRLNAAVLVPDAMIYSPWNPFRHGQHVLYTYLAFYWNDHSWLTKRRYTPKPFPNKAYSHKETNCKGLWTQGKLLDNSQAVFIACSNDVFLFKLRNQW